MNINDKVNLNDIVFIAFLRIFFFLVWVFRFAHVQDNSRRKGPNLCSCFGS